ncbi:inhibitor of apoptosis 3 [Mythimna separata entomopoxvirus 'L']|uniref:Inhibitor of apoptosis 3 n=1 Tax=Mythimna separata entomopoxvirus 'L' TaxID=1293572 RepID=A0A916KQ85_9POXV|nr:inhibitor of apoptosis 3 [Mythimna separata entomopoxvirus 'L']CCU56356.1 inhibitor of apoptosis 3 [Mythimna separata entomopoxvirus 'L']
MDNISNMCIEENRLLTFNNVWKNKFITPENLAKNGFYYVDNKDGKTDSVKCVNCKIVVHSWEKGDNVESEHKKFAPYCKFVKNENTNTYGYDECGSSVSKPINTYGPVHPKYKTEVYRVKSFKDWPPSISQKPEDLAEAGFFYTGLSDKVKCFYCDGGLKDWKAGELPWKEHARWYDKCEYVKIVKGLDFIQRVMSEACVVKNEENVVEIKEEKEVEYSKLCKICYLDEYNVCMSPCGHVFCGKCSININNICAICRQKCDSKIKLHYC